MIPEAGGVLARLRSALGSEAFLSRVDEWLVANTRLDKRPFSFKDHEFQIAIAKDISPEKVVKKCSQVGLSELQVRLTLALLAISGRWRGIFVLPTARFATKFSKDRIDPVIESSPTLRSMIIRAADSSEMKRIGGSTLYIAGSVGQKSAISVPATLLVIDEFDFCDQTTVSTYASRLRHAENGGFHHKFSTPTTAGYGISAAYDVSTQNCYMVKCQRCNEWQHPDHFEQLVIPGYDGEIKHFTKGDLDNPYYKVKEAYLGCIKCGADLLPSLADASRRQWVPKYPDREVSGYEVTPYDLVKYNPPAKVLAQLRDYRRLQDYYNFVLGKEFSSAETQVLDAIVEQNMILAPVVPGQVRTGLCYLGVDIGKTSHWVLMVPSDRELHVVAAGTITMREGEALDQQIIDLANLTGAAFTVVDGAPDFSTAQKVTQGLEGRAAASVYVRAKKKKSLDYFEFHKEEGTVTVERTKHFDELVKDINSGRMKFCRSVEMETARNHLQQMRRVEKENEEGETVAVWEKISGDDHYMHAIGFARLAWEIDGAQLGNRTLAVNINVSGVAVRTPEERVIGSPQSPWASMRPGHGLIGFRR